MMQSKILKHKVHMAVFSFLEFEQKLAF